MRSRQNEQYIKICLVTLPPMGNGISFTIYRMWYLFFVRRGESCRSLIFHTFDDVLKAFNDGTVEFHWHLVFGDVKD